MSSVRITSIAVAHPPHWITQDDAVRRITEATGDGRHVAAIAKGTQIEKRALAVGPDEMAAFGGIEARNDLYQRVAPELALEAARGALRAGDAEAIRQLVTSSCTGYMVPGWDVQLVQDLPLGANTARLPLTQPGCAGGLVALGQAVDYVRAHPGHKALAVAAELCSLAFHAETEPGNLTAALIFGDGAGAAVVEAADEERGGLEVVDRLSVLVPGTQAALGFALTDRGFYPLLGPELAEMLAGPTLEAACGLLASRGLKLEDVGFWLVHPGGARILKGLERCLGLDAGALRWSWESMRECGNMSSVSIFDVLRRYLADAEAPGGWGVVVAFGPGLSIEMLLVRRC